MLCVPGSEPVRRLLRLDMLLVLRLRSSGQRTDGTKGEEQ